MLKNEKVGRRTEIRSDEIRKIGQQSGPAPSAQDIIDEYQKAFCMTMEDIISKHHNYAPIYFISVITKKDSMNINFLRRKFVVRKTCPQPDWDQEIYSYNNAASCLKLEWVLPPFEQSIQILKKKDSHDPILVKCIQDFRGARLKIPTYSP